MPAPTYFPGPQPHTVRGSDGRVMPIPAGWVLFPPGDAALTRRVKAAGEHFVVAEKKGRKLFSLGVWAPAATIEQIRIDLEAEARSSLTVALVQIIRATSDSYAQVYTKGSLRKALSRACKVNFRIVTRICDRTLRGDIPDDPTRALLAVQLPSPLCFRSGAGHPNSRFSEAERLNVLRRLDQGVSPAQVAREVGASYELINDARNGVVWLSTQAAFRAEKAGAAGDGN